MKPKSKLLSLLLAICLVVGLMPTAAFAAGTDTGKAIQLVDSGTAANIGGGQADNIYFVVLTSDVVCSEGVILLNSVLLLIYLYSINTLWHKHTLGQTATEGSLSINAYVIQSN